MPSAKPTRSNVGKGMALGTAIATVIALVVQVTTGDGAVWAYVIPIGVAMGAAIGAGATAKPREEDSTPGP